MKSLSSKHPSATPVVRLAGMVLAIFLITPSWAWAASEQKIQIQEAYLELLSDEGYRPRLTKRGHIRFKREGLIHIIFVDERDPTFFHMSVRFRHSSKSAKALMRRLVAANKINLTTKLAKVSIDKAGSARVNAEMHVQRPSAAARHLHRLFGALDHAIDKYRNRIRQYQSIES